MTGYLRRIDSLATPPLGCYPEIDPRSLVMGDLALAMKAPSLRAIVGGGVFLFEDGPSPEPPNHRKDIPSLVQPERELPPQSGRTKGLAPRFHVTEVSIMTGEPDPLGVMIDGPCCCAAMVMGIRYRGFSEIRWRSRIP
jgi:hypothetical protein